MILPVRWIESFDYRYRLHTARPFRQDNQRACASVAGVNYPTASIIYTPFVTEFKCLTGQEHAKLALSAGTPA